MYAGNARYRQFGEFKSVYFVLELTDILTGPLIIGKIKTWDAFP